MVDNVRTSENDTEQSGPWNPGIQSQLPSDLRYFITLLNPQNIQQSKREVEELSTFTGLGIEQIATFTPERLITHELLIRVAANYSISDGNQYQDLGNNFRSIAQKLLDSHLQPHRQELVAEYEETKQKIQKLVHSAAVELMRPAKQTQPVPSWWQKLLGKKHQPTSPSLTPDHESKVLERWLASSLDQSLNELQRASYTSMAKVFGAVAVKHGRIIGDRELIGKLAVNHACNHYASQVIGEKMEALIEQGAIAEGYQALPLQEQPVIINVKGSSAAGKSTLRPLQQKLTRRLGLNWEDFALISPDIFRKFLLDYASLGEHYKYAGTCSGQELQIVDQKLDAYMAKKARQNKIPHLLIDRFRFDSFAVKSTQQGSNLLTRFGSRVFMTYVITPPHSTVERAWKRGLKVGRFKASDDLLDHNIEAFSGMPVIFFTWALNTEKDVYHEFLDNSVALGERPRTVAFGRNSTLNILDVEKLMDINRFQKLNVNAKSPTEVYPLPEEEMYRINFKFLIDCLKRLSQVNFCDDKTGEVFARCEEGHRVELNIDLSKRSLANADCQQAFLNLVHQIDKHPSAQITEPKCIELDYTTTLGKWGQQL